jgi:hypothetical protein
VAAAVAAVGRILVAVLFLAPLEILRLLLVFCSSLFVSSTLSEPDVAEMLTCVSLLLHHQMTEEREAGLDPSLPPPAYDFSEDDSVSDPTEMPRLQEFTAFLKKTFKVAKWSPECHIMALVFVNRLTGFTNIRLHNSNWRPILLCSLLLAQKVCATAPCTRWTARRACA